MSSMNIRTIAQKIVKSRSSSEKLQHEKVHKEWSMSDSIPLVRPRKTSSELNNWLRSAPVTIGFSSKGNEEFIEIIKQTACLHCKVALTRIFIFTEESNSDAQWKTLFVWTRLTRRSDCTSRWASNFYFSDSAIFFELRKRTRGRVQLSLNVRWNWFLNAFS